MNWHAYKCLYGVCCQCICWGHLQLQPGKWYLYKINFYWGIVAFQCCISFYCTAKWISYTYTYIPSFLDFCSPPGPFFNGILQPRILERVAIPFSRNLPDPGIKPVSPALQGDSLPSEPPGKPIYFILNIGNGYMSIPISQFIPLPLSSLVSMHLFSMSVSLFLLCK